MNPIDLMISVAALVLALGALAGSYSSRMVALGARRLARRVGLPLEASVQQRVRARVQRRLRFGSIGALVAVVVADLLLAAHLTGVAEGSDWVTLVGLLIVGIWGGLALGAATTHRGDASGERSATLTDYLPPIERLSAPILIGVALLLQLILWTARFWYPTGQSEFPAPAFFSLLAITIAGVVFWIVFEVFGRRIVAAGRPEGSANELAWDDALRSVALRDLAGAPIAIGLFTIALGGIRTIFLFVNLFSTEGVIVLQLAGALLVAGAATIAIIVVVSRPQRHFLRRLWPELARPSSAPGAAA